MIGTSVCVNKEVAETSEEDETVVETISLVDIMTVVIPGVMVALTIVGSLVGDVV